MRRSLKGRLHYIRGGGGRFVQKIDRKREQIPQKDRFVPKKQRYSEQTLLFYLKETEKFEFVSQLSDNLARVADCNNVCRDILGYDGTGSDCGIISDGHSRKDGHAAANPYIVTDGHGLGPFPTTVTFNRIRAVASRVNAHIGADKAVVPDGHRSLVQHREIEIGEETLADTDLFAIIAVERLIDTDMIVSDMAQQIS